MITSALEICLLLAPVLLLSVIALVGVLAVRSGGQFRATVAALGVLDLVFVVVLCLMHVLPAWHLWEPTARAATFGYQIAALYFASGCVLSTVLAMGPSRCRWLFQLLPTTGIRGRWLLAAVAILGLLGPGLLWVCTNVLSAPVLRANGSAWLVLFGLLCFAFHLLPLGDVLARGWFPPAKSE